MKRITVLIGIFLLLTVTISHAQIKLVGKSRIKPVKNHLFATGLLADNTKTGETLTVWRDLTSDPDSVKTAPIVGRFIKGKAIGKPFPIVTQTHNPQDILGVALSVAYNPVTNEYLLAYHEGHQYGVEPLQDTWQIYVLRLSAAGKPIGKAIDITSNDPRLAPYQSNPGPLKFHPKTGGYFFLNGNHGDIQVAGDAYQYFALLNADGTLNGSFQRIDPVGGPRPARRIEVGVSHVSGFLPSGKLLTLWNIEWVNVSKLDWKDLGLACVSLKKLKTLKQSRFKVLHHYLNPDPQKGKGAFRFVVGSLAFSSPKTPFVYFNDDEKVNGQKINSKGKLSGPAFKAFNPPLDNKVFPQLNAAFATTSTGVRGILMTYDDGPYYDHSEAPVSIWAQVLDENGKPIGSPVKVYTTKANEIVDGSSIVAWPVQPGDTAAHFSWFGVMLRTDKIEQGLPGASTLTLDVSVTLP